MAWVGKKYKLEKQENFEEYMKSIGKALELRFSIILSIFHLRKFSIKEKDKCNDRKNVERCIKRRSHTLALKSISFDAKIKKERPCTPKNSLNIKTGLF
jgi:hypothetical protein